LALSFQNNFRPHPHLCSWVLRNDWKNTIASASVRNEFFTKNWKSYVMNKVCSSKVRKTLNVEPLLLRIERSQLRWSGHASRKPQERLPKQALLAKEKGKRPVGQLRTRNRKTTLGSWMELLGASNKRNIRGGGRPCYVAAWVAAPAILTDKSGSEWRRCPSLDLSKINKQVCGLARKGYGMETR